MDNEYTKIAASVLDSLISKGLTHAEVVAVCKFASDAISAVEQAGGDPVELFSEDREKAANAILDAVAGLGGKVMEGTWNTAGRLAEKGIDASIRYAPLTLAAGLAIPAIAGYTAGRSVGTLTDQPEEMVRAIQQRELVALLEENARNAKQHKLIDEGRTALTPRRRKRV